MATLLLAVPFFLTITSSCSIFFSRYSCFFTNISSVTLSFCIASDVVGALSSFLPPNTLLKKLILFIL
uniref:Uncharacterized protein n=1 Tax=Panstrongylus lignarius TaxID=156445 RepID=A0A224Y5L6_9HEMI